MLSSLAMVFKPIFPLDTGLLAINKTALTPYLHVFDSISVKFDRNFIYPFLVSSPFKISIQKGLYNDNCLWFSNKSSRQCTYIGIVMRPGQTAYLLIPAEC